MANRIPFSRAQYFDADNNQAFAGAKMYTFDASANTAKETFTDAGEGTPHANPIVADENGIFPEIYGDGSYKIRIFSNDDSVLLFESNSIAGVLTESFIADLANNTDAAKGSALVGHLTQDNQSTTVQAELRKNLTVTAPRDGTDVIATTAACVAAFAEIVDSTLITLPAGFYLVSTDAIAIPAAVNANVTIDLRGVTFLTNDTTGVLLNLNPSATSGDDTGAIKRFITVIGGAFYNLNGTNLATNNTCTAVKALALRDSSITRGKYGSSDSVEAPPGSGNTAGFGWNVAIDNSSFDGTRVENNFFVNNDTHVLVDDVFTTTKCQNGHIVRNNMVKCFGDAQILIKTAISDFEIAYNDTAQPDKGTQASPTNTFPAFLKFDSGTSSFDNGTRGLNLIGNNTEQNQSRTGPLVQCVARDGKRAENIRSVGNKWIGDNIALDFDQTEGMIEINDYFFTPLATAIKIREHTGTLKLDGSTFKQAAVIRTIVSIADSTANPGSATTITVDTASTYPDGELVTIANQASYNGDHVISESSGVVFDIPVIFVPEAATGTTTATGTILDVNFSATEYNVGGWANVQVPQNNLGNIIRTHKNGNSTRGRWNRTPTIFSDTFNGGDGQTQKGSVQLSTFDGVATLSTSTVTLTPFDDIGNSALFEHNTNETIDKYYIVAHAEDTGSAAGSPAPYVRIYPKGYGDSAASPAFEINLEGVKDGARRSQSGWVAVNIDGQIEVDIVASSASAIKVSIACWGFG